MSELKKNIGATLVNKGAQQQLQQQLQQQ